MTTKNKTGRHLVERNTQIIADSVDGMTPREIAAKHGISYGYAQKLASDYKHKEKIRKVEHVKSGHMLYANRDAALIKVYESRAA